MKRIVKWVLTGIVIVGCIGGYLYYSNLPLAVDTTLLEPKTASLDFTEEGYVAESTAIAVYPFVSGPLLELLAEEGQEVEAGDILAIVDSVDYRFQILRTQSSIQGYEAQISNLDIEERRERESLVSSRDSLLGELAALKAQRETAIVSKDEQIRVQNLIIRQGEEDTRRAAENLDKAKILYNNGAMSRQDYEAVEEVYNTRLNQLEQARRQLLLIESSEGLSNEAYFSAMESSLQAQILGIETTLGGSYTSAMKSYYNSLIQDAVISVEQLEKQIQDCSVTAPISGIIAELYIKESNVVSAQSPVALIKSRDEAEIHVYVSTEDIEEINIQDQVELIFKRRSGDKLVPGIITEIEKEAEIKVSALGVEERRVKVKVVTLEEYELFEGFNVDVKFNIYRREESISVPKTALFEDGEEHKVWVVRDGQAYQTAVAKGMELRTEYVIEEGLNPGDIIIDDASEEGLREGARISIE